MIEVQDFDFTEDIKTRLNFQIQKIFNLKIKEYFENNILHGTILAYNGSTAPTGAVEADGSEVAKATYPKIYAAVGDINGAAVDPTNNFLLPDWSGQALPANHIWIIVEDYVL